MFRVSLGRKVEKLRERRKKKYYLDVNFLFIIISLLVFGLLMIYSTSSYEASMDFGDAAFYLKKQLLATSLGVVIMIATARIPYQVFQTTRFTGLLQFWPIIIGAVSLLMLYTPLAYSANGATRWLNIGPFSLQPAEIVKLMVIIYLASFVTKYPTSIREWKGMLHFMFPPVVLAIMIYGISSNLSSAIIVVGIAAVMLFVATPDYKRYILIALAVIAVAVAVVAYVANQDPAAGMNYRGERIMAWLNPEAYADDEGYQTLQSLYAIGSGGFWGKGLGESVQKLGFIPEAQNDMIFSIICEELGLLGAIVIIVLFIALLYRCLFIATHAKDLFGAMLVVGVMGHIAIQVILNIAVVTATIPNTGISLPFISYGGTSVVFLLIEVGLVLGVGRQIQMSEE